MRVARLLVLSALAACTSCSSSEPRSEPAPPAVVVDDCPPTELPIVGGGCRKVGARECGEGFTLDEDRGCSPILPASPCGPGTMAVPGDPTCRPVVACGDGKWGTIPVASGAVFVDASYAGGASDGSADKPFRTIQAAIDAASPGAIVAVADGTYAENVRLDRRVKLWGRCPEKVSIVGTATFALDVTVDSEVHDLAITGPDVALGVAGATVLAEGVWIHDAGDRGVDVEDVGAPTALTLRSSLVEGTAQIGVYVEGSKVTLERSVVRGTRGAKKGEVTEGILARAGAASRTPSRLRVVSSLVDDNTVYGVLAYDSSAEIEGSVVRATKRTSASPASGITVQKLPEGESAELTVTRSLVDGHQGVGIDAASATATIDTVTIRDIFAVGGGAMLLESTTGKVTNLTIVDIGGTGLAVRSGNVEIARARIARVVADSAGSTGPGLQVDSDRGRAEVTISEVLLRDLRAAGIGAFGSRVAISDVAILGVQKNQKDAFGDGIGLSTVGWESGEIDVIDATITRVIVRDAARAAIAMFGGRVRIGQSVLCSPIDINTEKTYGYLSDRTAVQHEVHLEDLGGNLCGCGAPARCVAKSAGLLPFER